jgi:tRNA pseudouridine(38-40) synthase
LALFCSNLNLVVFSQFGKQANVTVESKLFDAMLKTGLITPELAKKPIDFHFQRAARTDRAVSAVRQCCSMWLEMDKDANIDVLPARINAEMPDDIRVIGAFFLLLSSIRLFVFVMHSW